MSQSLFDTAETTKKPLAERMRPSSFDEVLGQPHITAPESLFRKSVLEDRISSVILYGPPGTGKTTLARLVAFYTKKQFKELNAVFSTVQNLKAIIKEAQDAQRYYSKGTILFVDEIHRWNKAQQEALLPWIEDGTIILIGATTQNPFFELTGALLSRVQVFELFRLEEEQLITAIERALTDDRRGYGALKLTIDPQATLFLVQHTGGDVRIVYNVLEWIVETHSLYETMITYPMAEEALQKKVLLYDRDGDYHYDTASAFIKSVRGSDPDAALFWASVMLESGEDPRFIFRRLLIASAEDIGLADPHAIQLVTSCAEAFDRVGMPEGSYFIAEAVLYCALCPKSNSLGALFTARKLARTQDFSVPLELRDASKDGNVLGHGTGYQYPHDYPGHWIPHSYMPARLQNNFFYKPSRIGYENSCFQKTMLRHTSILLAEELQLAMVDAHGVIAAYLNLCNAVQAELPTFENMLVVTDQGLIFSRIACITHDTAKRCILALPQSSFEVCKSRYFSDFEQALLPNWFLLHAASDAELLDQCSLEAFAHDCTTQELIVYGVPKHKTNNDTVQSLFALLAKHFLKIVYIEPVAFQKGLIPQLLKNQLDANSYSALLAYDHEYFTLKTTVYTGNEDSGIYCNKVRTVEAFVERKLTESLREQLVTMSHEYVEHSPLNIGLNKLNEVFEACTLQDSLHWRYAWDIYVIEQAADSCTPNIGHGI